MRFLGLMIGSIMFAWGVVSLVPEFFLLVYTQGELMRVLFAMRSLSSNPLAAGTIVAFAGLLLILQSLRAWVSARGAAPPLN